ncbi:MAG: cation:proton antiporter subunit C [Alphaproteobacteria bacterium]|jgi:multicomponent Na+:H+ antiporter subunit C|nr:cation:proton antiporter subunit C [Rhodospirillaceae bacterium]MBT6204554.1 cation:proton antiporter subunit C [Rhodospirillaceae bacterium]MBT7614464.1 cation:proton antiporter subunit C [Rhodospirillaceae bacterium]MBT7645633.1 cation:proton antiporter subunit C [Rhodospirillaceae bacterium]MDG2481849.1 cation:proton antiporter subunit C [Alphaproteobacteria bacterium]
MTAFVTLLSDHAIQWGAITLLMIGLYIVLTRGNLIKKVVGLNIFQTAVFLLYISMGYVEGGTAPIVLLGAERYSNPLPHVLILTAIVVSVATTSLALALIVRIHEGYGSIEEDEILERDDG